MKIPRDLSGKDLIKMLRRFDYEITRQRGSHIRLSRKIEPEHHITIPDHPSIKIGTVNKILTDVSTHLKISKEELLKTLLS